MAILIDESTRLVVQGLTGKEGQFHGFRNRNIMYISLSVSLDKTLVSAEGRSLASAR